MGIKGGHSYAIRVVPSSTIQLPSMTGTEAEDSSQLIQTPSSGTQSQGIPTGGDPNDSRVLSDVAVESEYSGLERRRSSDVLSTSDGAEQQRDGPATSTSRAEESNAGSSSMSDVSGRKDAEDHLAAMTSSQQRSPLMESTSQHHPLVDEVATSSLPGPVEYKWLLWYIISTNALPTEVIQAWKDYFFHQPANTGCGLVFWLCMTCTSVRRIQWLWTLSITRGLLCPTFDITDKLGNLEKSQRKLSNQETHSMHIH
ncbi:hypothetical protein PROFUN_13538 [Planoprotostelium fungivorum]|uniref:Uncharacterized protein n=1 Tax=Planoprotostelium fungivorum TaxID=1890364 RepID=A0A2P6N3Q2_9EUKA|nr:hypothetical protein PROFUN_13538 [Planoprotostelium fungivorum]